jgi:hypothetical protein
LQCRPCFVAPQQPEAHAVFAPSRRERRIVMGVIAVVMLSSIALYLFQQIDDLKI